mgnify:FL=1
MSASRVLSTLKRSIMTRANKSEFGEVSSVDVRNVGRNSVSGPERGGLVASAFKQLVSEGQLVKTTSRVLNRDTRSRVSVYILA